MAEESEGQSISGVSKSAIPVTIIYRPRSVTMCYVSDQELDSIGSANNSVNLAFACLSFGGWLALAITVLTVTLENPYTFAAFWAGFWLCLVLTGYFGIKAFLDFRKARKHIASIKEVRQIETSTP